MDEEIERVHYGREDVYSCPIQIRPLINELRKIKNWIMWYFTYLQYIDFYLKI